MLNEGMPLGESACAEITSKQQQVLFLVCENIRPRQACSLLDTVVVCVAYCMVNKGSHTMWVLLYMECQVLSSYI